jgi:uncharacterized protein
MADRPKAAARRPLLIIMLKAPVMGLVKTRLARDIGLAEATRFARISARTITLRLARDTRWRTVLAVAPDNDIASRRWFARCPIIGQGRGDLGARMGRLLAPALRPAILIGADIPGVSSAIIARAFDTLRRSDAVFGPAEDGGYWLVGLNRGAPKGDVFGNVRWSTPHALADTLANFERSRVGFATRLADVDDVASWRQNAHLAGTITGP